MSTAESMKHVYKVNDVSGYYEKISAPVGFIKLPFDLKLSSPQRKDYKDKTQFILSGRIVKGKKTFFTGLISTGVAYWFFGDHFHPNETQKNSFCLFRFNEISTELTIYYFNHYKLYPNKREQFIRDFIQSVGK